MVRHQVQVLVLSALLTPPLYAETISTPQVLERTLSALSTCLDWRWVGSCLWMDCDLLGCRVLTSMKVRHYLPDLLVTVQRSPADTPWLEMQHLLGPVQETALATLMNRLTGGTFTTGGGHAAVTQSQFGNANLNFFEASVFGHPLAQLPVIRDRLFCESVTRSGKPYFESTIDAVAWRLAPFESMLPESLVPGQREIWDGVSHSWSALYPRSGYVVQQSPAKAAAVVAQRACNIVAGPRRDHLARSLEVPAAFTRPPPQLNERDPGTGLWQQISPGVDTDCTLFGSNDPGWDYGRIDASQAFMWNLWRPYECCRQNGATFLGDLDF